MPSVESIAEELWGRALDAAKRGDEATADALAEAAKAVGRASRRYVPVHPQPLPVYPGLWPTYPRPPYITWTTTAGRSTKGVIV